MWERRPASASVTLRQVLGGKCSAASARRQVLDDMRTSGAAPVSVVGDHRQWLGLLTPQNVAEMMIKQVKLDWRFGR